MATKQKQPSKGGTPGKGGKGGKAPQGGAGKGGAPKGGAPRAGAPKGGGGKGVYSNAGTPYGSWPASFGASTNTSLEFSLYATYTPTGGGTATPGAGPGSSGPVLLVTTAANPYSRYYTEILKAEGLNHYQVVDLAQVTPALLAQHDLVLLGETPLTDAQVTVLSDWTNGGGRLIAMRPDKKLAPEQTAKVQAYSQPITPPPITIMLRGIFGRRRIVSESTTTRSSKGTSAGRAGIDPEATRKTSPVMRRGSWW